MTNLPITPPAERLSLVHVYVQTFRILRRDFLPVMALVLLVAGAGLAAQGWLEHWMEGQIKVRPTAQLIPWLAGFTPGALADAAIVWVALRRLGGAPTLKGLGGLRGALMLVAVVMAIDLVESAPDLIDLMMPKAAIQQLGDYYLTLVLIVDAAWQALWLPAIAVAVSERAGSATSLGRSLDLTSVARWALVSLNLSVGLVALAVVELSGLGMTALGFGWLPIWVAEIIALPVTAAGSITQAVVYWELTRLKTGRPPAAAAAVFD